MKSKDQVLLEEAYKKVNKQPLAKVVRLATEEELWTLEQYSNEEITEGRYRYNVDGLDFSKGWVWEGAEKDPSKTYISVRDRATGGNGDRMEDYTTFGIWDGEGVFWLGHTNGQGQLTADAIKYYGLRKELPELEGIF